ncbi:hypothetical protein ACROYT_G020377 [Oculina patagonica]
MKIFVVLLLLSAFSAYVSANEMFPTAVIDFLEERHDEGMVQVLRDNGLPEDTLVLAERGQQPDWLKPCIDQGKACWNKTGHDTCKMLACIDNFWKCYMTHHPTPLPTLSPLHKACSALLYLCRAHSISCAGKLCCYVRIKKCFELQPKPTVGIGA